MMYPTIPLRSWALSKAINYVWTCWIKAVEWLFWFKMHFFFFYFFIFRKGTVKQLHFSTFVLPEIWWQLWSWSMGKGLSHSSWAHWGWLGMCSQCLFSQYSFWRWAPTSVTRTVSSTPQASWPLLCLRQ